MKSIVITPAKEADPAVIDAFVALLERWPDLKSDNCATQLFSIMVKLAISEGATVEIQTTDNTEDTDSSTPNPLETKMERKYRAICSDLEPSYFKGRVQVLSKSRQKSCRHEFRPREYCVSDRLWKFVCRKCGIVSRLPTAH